MSTYTALLCGQTLCVHPNDGHLYAPSYFPSSRPLTSSMGKASSFPSYSRRWRDTNCLAPGRVTSQGQNPNPIFKCSSVYFVYT